MHALFLFKKHPLTLAIQACCYTMLGAASFAHAAPLGGEVVGGTGAITQSGLATTINQSSQNLAVNWQSFNISSDERVQFIQPNTSSIALNRILSNNGSVIAGRIDANGQVILANPNGVFFTPSATLNVGGIIASGLDITPTDFMNGQYLFHEIPGSNGAVINSGMINASLGGNVALLGKQVENNGLIAATLGSVTLAAGRQAVLTFDNGGLLGVRVSEAMLQKDLGVDPAVINRGDIQAHGGRVLLTASVSQDVFSSAVNTQGVASATSVVVNADGSFTLGNGADVLNSGSIDTSTTRADQNVGRIVVLGENVTSSGSLHADAANGSGGEIELHAQDTTLLTQSSVTTARAENGGQGGVVKVLGDRVGVLDLSLVDVSGAMAGGQALIGGDKEGKNPAIRNANFIFLSEQSQVAADGLVNGNGGKIITFAEDTARVYGNLHARGGTNGGDGGFIETSGLRGFEILTAPDAGAGQGVAGLWLIDPYNLTITSGNKNPSVSNGPTFSATGSGASLGVDLIIAALGSSSVVISTGSSGTTESGNITLTSTADIDYDGVTGRTLTLNAAGNILFQTGSRIYDSKPTDSNGADYLNVVLMAGGVVQLASGASITTQGGSFSVGSTSNRVASFTNSGMLDTSTARGCGSPGCTIGGVVDIYTTGNIISNGITTTGGVGTSSVFGGGGGSVTLNASGANATIAVNGVVNTSGGADNTGGSNARGGVAGSVALTAAGGISLGGNITASGGSSTPTTGAGNGANITFAGPVNLMGNVQIDANGSTRGDILFNSTLDSQVATQRTLALSGRNITFSGIVGNNARLGGTTINATGTVNAATNAISANSLSVAQSSSFTSGAINTSGGATGGPVNILSGDIKAGTINTSGNTTGGSVTLAATDNSANGTPSIILDGDVNASGATASGTVQLSLNGSSSPTGSVTINYPGDFTSSVNITGSGGTDTLNAANRTNNWIITGTGAGSLNRNVANTLPAVAFTAFENLTGGSGNDTFTINAGGLVAGTIATGAGANTVTVNGSVGAISGLFGNGANTVYVNTGGIVSGGITMGSGIDTFNIGGTVGGLIDGGAGADTLNVSATDKTVKLGTPVLNLGYLNVDHVESINASGTGNTLLGNDNNAVLTTWNVNALNQGTVAYTSDIATTATFTGFDNLTGGSGNDSFTLVNAGDITGTISGGGEGLLGDTLTVSSGNNTWLITAVKTGSVTNAGTTNFTGIENLVGGTGDDAFTFNVSPTTAAVTVSGGDAPGMDTVNFNLANTAINVQLGATGFSGIETINNTGLGSSGTLTGSNTTTNTWTVNAANGGSVFNGSETTAFGGFSNLTGGNLADDFIITGTGSISGMVDGGSGSNSLRGRDTNGSWTITNINAGNVADVGITYVAGFTNIQSLKGGTGDDLFSFQPGSSLVSINGGDGYDTVDLHLLSAVNIILGATGYSNIENYIGNDTNSVLSGSTTINTWSVTGVNGGTFSDGVTTTAFSNFNNLVGGGANDTFNFSGPGKITGYVDGGLGINDVHLGSATSGDATLLAAATTGSTGFANIQTITGKGSNSSLTGAAVANLWTLSGTNAGSVSYAGKATTFSGFGNLIGGADTDTYTYTSSGSVTGYIDGRAGTDSVNLSALAAAYVTLGTSGAYRNIEQFTGNNTASTLQGGAIANIWELTGPNAGTINSTSYSALFTNFNNLTGGSSSDTFNIATLGNLTGLIDGGAGTNTLNISTSTAPIMVRLLDAVPVMPLNNPAGTLSVYQMGTLTGNSAVNHTLTADVTNPLTTTTSWTIDAVNSGTINFGPIASFTGFRNLTGTAGNDTFTINSGSKVLVPITGLIDGGGQTVGGEDTLILSTTESISILLGSTLTTNDLNVNGIETIQGNSKSSLTASNGKNDWVITGANDGTVSLNVDTTNEQVAFTNFTALKGGSGDDNFQILYSAQPNASIDGGLQTTRDTIDYSAQNAPVVNFGTAAFNGITGIEAVRGNGTNSTLNGPATADSFWTVTGVNTGTVQGGSSFTMGFEGFNYLVAGSGKNTFTITDGSLRNVVTNLPGLILSGGGNNTVNVNLSGTGISTGQIDYVGSAGNADIININNTSTNAYEASYTPVVGIWDPKKFANSGLYEQVSFSYANPNAGVNTSFALNYRNAGTVNSALSVNTFTVNGNGADSTVLSNGNFKVGARTQVGYQNVTNLTATGPGPIDVNNANISGTLTLANAGSVTSSALTAAALVLNNIGQAGTSTARLNTDIGSLSILNSGPVYLFEASGLALGPINTANLIDIQAGGSITNSGPIVSSGALTLSTTGNILLNTPNQNILSGPLNLTGSTIDIDNTASTNIASITAATLKINSGGNITQTGAIIVSGDTSLSAASGSVLLDNAANNFNTLNVNAASAVLIRDIDRINSGSISASSIDLRTATGIGSGDILSPKPTVLSTSTSNLTVKNDSGSVLIANTGPVSASIITQGDILFTNNADVRVRQLNANGGSQTPAANLGGNILLSVTGSAYGNPDTKVDYNVTPDIVAQNFTGLLLSGNPRDVGQYGRPMSVLVNNEFTIYADHAYIHYLGANKPSNININAILLEYVNFNGLNEQLIDVESLGEFDPAIFTAVRNYYYEDVAIMMPDDQRLDGSDGDEEEKDKKKDEKL